MKKYMMMVGLINLIGLDYGRAMFSAAEHPLDSSITIDSKKNFQKNEEVIKTESSSDLSAKKRPSPDSLTAIGPNTKNRKINADEKENITTEFSSGSLKKFQEFIQDVDKIDSFVKIAIKELQKLKNLKKSEEISKTFQSEKISDAFQSLINELNAKNKIRRIIAYIDDKFFHPNSLIENGLKDANDVDSFLKALECVVFNNIQ